MQDTKLSANEKRIKQIKHDRAADEYECPMGKRLKLQTDKANGFSYRRYHANARDCEVTTDKTFKCLTNLSYMIK
jgi:hypothetical protein